MSGTGVDLAVIEPRPATRHELGHPGTAVLVTIGVVAIGAVLGIVMPLWLIAEVPDVGRSGAWPFSAALMVWSGIRIAIAISRSRPAMFDFFFWLFCYIFMGIAPTVQMRSGEIAGTTPGIDPSLDLPTVLVVWLGVLAYEAAYWVAALRERRGGVRPSEDLPEIIPDVDRTRSYILIAVGLLASAYFVAGIGPGVLFSSRDAAFDARSAQWPDPAIRSIVYASAVYPLLIGIGAISQIHRKERAHWQRAVQILATLVLLAIDNPISNARYNFGTVLFALAVLAGAVATVRRTRITLIASILGLLFVFPIADAFRRIDGTNFTRDGFFGEYRGAGDYDAFWQISNALSFLYDGLMHVGEQGLGVLLFWVPRSLWAGKPDDTGAMLAQYRGYTYDNLSAPFWAEFLVNGGIPLVVIGFLVTGYAWRRLDARVDAALVHYGAWAIAGAVFPVFTTMLLRGSLLQTMDTVTISAVCLLWVTDWRGRRRQLGERAHRRTRTPALARSRP